MAYTLNPFTGKFDANGNTLTSLDARYLKLDCSNDPLTDDLVIQGHLEIGNAAYDRLVIADNGTAKISLSKQGNDDIFDITHNAYYDGSWNAYDATRYATRFHAESTTTYAKWNLQFSGAGATPSFTTALEISDGGELRIGDGTLARPAFTFLNDLDSGLYRIGADNIGLVVNGTNLLDITTTTLTTPANITFSSSGGAITQTAASITLTGGNTSGDKLYLRANSGSTNPYILVDDTTDDVTVYVDSGDNFIVRSGTTKSFYTDDAQSVFETVQITGVAGLFDFDSVTSGTCVQIDGVGITSGDALKIRLDSDNVTTGNAIRVLSGSASATSVFTVNEDGDIENLGSITASLAISGSAIYGANVTSGTDPGHTHTSASISSSGNDTWVQYNDGGSFGSDAGFTTDKAGSVTLSGSLQASSLTATGSVYTDGIYNSGSYWYTGTNPCYIYGGDTTGDDLYLHANTIDGTQSSIHLLGDGGIDFDIDKGDNYQFSLDGDATFMVDEENIVFNTSDPTGYAVDFRYDSGVTTSGDITMLDLDVSSGVTYGTNKGGNALRLVTKAANGSGQSYLIRGYNITTEKFQVDSDGNVTLSAGGITAASALNLGGNIYFNTNANHNIYGGTTSGNDLFIYANSTDSYPVLGLYGNSNAGFNVPNGNNFYVTVAGSSTWDLGKTTSYYLTGQTTGSAFKTHWQTTTTTNDVVGQEIDASTNLTFGANKGSTGLKITGKVANGTGTSYGIDIQGDAEKAINIAAGDIDVTFGADEKLFIDATTTDHTDTAGVIDLDIDAAADDVRGMHITATSQGDYTGMYGVLSQIASGGMTTAFDNNLSFASLIADNASDAADTIVGGLGILNTGGSAAGSAANWFGNFLVWDVAYGGANIQSTGDKIGFFGIINDIGGTGDLTGFQCSLTNGTNPAGNIIGANLNLVPNIAGATAIGVNVSNTGSQSGAYGYYLSGTWLNGIDLSGANLTSDIVFSASAGKITSAATLTNIYGGDTASDILNLYANSSDSYPYIGLTGGLSTTINPAMGDVITFSDTKGIKIDGSYTDAIDLTGSLATNGITMSGATLTYDIVLQNGETITNSPAGTIDFGAANLTTTGTGDFGTFVTPYANTVTVAKSGGDYTTVQEALDASGANTLVLVYPGTYDYDVDNNNTIHFTANNQIVRGMGAAPKDCLLTADNANLIDYSTYTGCKIYKIKAEVTAATSLVSTVIGSSGSCNFKQCHIVMTTAYTTAGQQPCCYASIGNGTVNISEGTIEYNHTGVVAEIKSAICWFANAPAYDLKRVNIDVNGSGASTAITIGYGTGNATIDVNECVGYIDDVDTTIPAGFYIGGGGSGEFAYNLLHVTGGQTNAYGVYIAGTPNVRGMFNHIHVTGATNNYSYYLGGAATLNSQFEDMIAPAGINNAGGATVNVVNSPVDGYLTATGTVQAEQLTSTDDADINDNLTAGDIAIDEAVGVLDFTGGTVGSITASGSGKLSIGGTDKIVYCTTFTSAGINAAIDQLGTEGGVVILPEGTYTIDGTITVDYDYTVIRGEGWGTVLDASGWSTDHIINLNGCDYCQVKDLKILGNAGGGNDKSLIYGSGCTYTTIAGCWLEDSDDQGIELVSGSNKSLIRDNIAIDCDYAGIWLNSCLSCRVVNNYTLDNVNEGIALWTNCNYSVIANNIVDDDKYGIYVYASNVSVIANTTYGGTQSGIYIQGNYDFVNGNTGRNNGAHTIISQGSYNSFSANIAHNPGKSGIYIWNNPYYNVINANVCHDAGNTYSDYYISGGTGNIFTNNSGISGAGDSERLLELINCADTTVSGNYSTGHDTEGINEDASCTGSLIYGNHINDTTPYNLNGGTYYDLELKGGNLLQDADTYHNWGTTSGSGGYGFRDNSGAMEYKDSGGSWTAFNSLNNYVHRLQVNAGADDLYVTYNGNNETLYNIDFN